MAAPMVINLSRSNSPSSITTIAVSTPSEAHSLTPTVFGNHAGAFQSEIDFPTKEMAAPLPFLPKPNTDPNLVAWDGPDDPTNPQNWSFWYKSWLTAVSSVMILAVTFTCSAPSSSIPVIAQEFRVGQEVGNLIFTVFIFGFAFGPPLWAPGSELIGRRPISIYTLALFTLFHIGQVDANNMTTLLVTRFLSGFFASAALTNSVGVIADIWDTIERGIALSVAIGAGFIGPAAGPFVGIFTSNELGWRRVFFVTAMLAGLSTLLSVFVPETYAPVLLAQKAKRLRAADPVKNKDIYAESDRVSWTLLAILERTIFRPFKMQLVEPILLLTTIYISLAYGVMYAMFEAVPLIFIGTHHFSVSNDGLIFIGIGIGAALATVINFWFLRRYRRLLKEWYGFPPAEERLYSAMLGGPVLAIGIFCLGWSGNYESVPWWVPGIGTILIGFAIALIITSFTTYLVDTYLMHAASALTGNIITRYLVGAVFPLFSTPMFDNLGINWAGTLLGSIALILAPIPFLFYKYGQRIRTKSSFAPCVDLEVAKFLEEEKLAVVLRDERWPKRADDLVSFLNI